MLQCTALTEVPEAEALVALITMEGAPHNPMDVLSPDDFLLCELAEHDEGAEHAAHLWTAEPSSSRELWIFWADRGARRVHRFAELFPCPGTLRYLATGDAQGCALHVQHPAAHSWDVTDPLGDLVDDLVEEGSSRTPNEDDSQRT
ncbi:hypothetical protein [Streptomyces parvus]|uniref:hypothetical protein n=1 Tax=Streptomyces parvus TaxID=66428 RepID=UPI0033CA1213